jgi:hypothetical protein
MALSIRARENRRTAACLPTAAVLAQCAWTALGARCGRSVVRGGGCNRTTTRPFCPRHHSPLLCRSPLSMQPAEPSVPPPGSLPGPLAARCVRAQRVSTALSGRFRRPFDRLLYFCDRLLEQRRRRATSSRQRSAAPPQAYSNPHDSPLPASGSAAFWRVRPMPAAGASTATA